MKKEIFGIAATMLFVGTMAITSCSDDCVFGYDEEWDDLVPRTKQNFLDKPEYYDWDLPDQCMLQAYAQSKGYNIYTMTEDDYHTVVASYMDCETWSQSIQNSYVSGIAYGYTDDEIKSRFNWTTVITQSEEQLDPSSINFESNVVGRRMKDGKPHVDYITDYRPAGRYGLLRNEHPAEF